MYVPPYELILRRLGLSKGDVEDSDLVGIPLGLLKLLLQTAVSSEPFDEQLYLKSYEDVQAAIEAGIFDRAARHYLGVGYFEGRHNPAIEFEPHWYLARYPEAEDDIKSHRLSSVFAHYLLFGRSRGYAPSEAAARQLAHWENVLPR